MILTKSSWYLNTVRTASRLKVERDWVRGGQKLVGAGSSGPPVKLDSIAIAGDPRGALADTHLHCVARVLEPWVSTDMIISCLWRSHQSSTGRKYFSCFRYVCSWSPIVNFLCPSYKYVIIFKHHPVLWSQSPKSKESDLKTKTKGLWLTHQVSHHHPLNTSKIKK